METEARRYQELMVRHEQKVGELGAAQLKYEQLKERVRRKAAQAGPRVSGSVQAPAARSGGSTFSLDTFVAVGALAGSAGAGPQRSVAPAASVTSRPPLSGQRRRREEEEQQQDQPRQDEDAREGEGSRQD